MQRLWLIDEVSSLYEQETFDTVVLTAEAQGAHFVLLQKFNRTPPFSETYK